MSVCRTLMLAFALWVTSPSVAALNQHELTTYAEIRWQMFRKPDFQPYQADVIVTAQINKAKSLWNESKVDEAISTVKELLKTYPGSISATGALSDMFKALIAASPPNRPDLTTKLQEIQSKYYKDYDGLLQSILASGDGKSPATAYKVISVKEEYATISHLGHKKISQRLLNQNNKAYDAIEVKDDSGAELTIYFDVTPLFDKMASTLK